MWGRKEVESDNTQSLVGVKYMSQRKLDTEITLERVGNIERTLEFLRRDIIKGIESSEKETRTSLHGSVRGGDITEEMIDEQSEPYLEIWRTYR